MSCRATPILRLLLLPWLSALLLACGEEAQHAGHRTSPPDVEGRVERVQDFARIANGRRLFAEHCAACHGAGAEGDPDWRYRDESGYFPPPPLNGTAHAWHHTWEELHHIIRDGQNNMPAWGEVLAGEEIDDTIAWFQSLWPEAVYAAWHRIDSRARQVSDVSSR